MANQDWDPNEWQGRKRKQVESNQQIAVWAMGGLVLIILFFLLAECYRMLAHNS